MRLIDSTCWMASTAALALALPAAAQQQVPSAAEATQAQGAAGVDPGPATATDAAPATASGDVVVTGSRIARPNNQAPNPITTFDAANIQQSGNTNITTFLQRVPALNNSRDSTQTSGGNATYGTFGQTGLNELTCATWAPRARWCWSTVAVTSPARQAPRPLTSTAFPPT